MSASGPPVGPSVGPKSESPSGWSSSAIARRELLIEVGCEEIPADWLGGLIARFAADLGSGLREAGLDPGKAAGYGAPRRLSAQVEGVLLRQPDRSERILGPPARVARTPEGAWSRAALGFARRQGVAEAALEETLSVFSTPRGEYLGIRRAAPGRPALEIVPEVLEAALRSLPFPKTMHWDAAVSGRPFPFGRPIRWLLALLGGEVVPFSIEVEGAAPVVAGNTSRGHRFRSAAGPPGEPFAVSSFADLAEGLARRSVVLDPAARAAELRRKIEAAAGGAPVVWPPDPLGDLVECPGAVRGEYPEEFESLPEEIRRTVLVHHQKYLPVAGQRAFVAVTNLPDDPGGAIRRGAERVVLARLRDARFFWDDDRKAALADRAPALAGIVFHRRLGSLRGKSERIERLARSLAARVGADDEAAGRAAALAKCDLGTGLVGEFASLQGVAGGLYLREEGAPEAVWRAVYDHYRPEGLEGRLPDTVEGAAVSLADRADTLAGFFLAGESPTGSGDPYGLRRAALSLLRTLRDAPDAYPGTVPEGWPTPLDLVEEALSGYEATAEARGAVLGTLEEFLRDRLPRALGGADLPAGVVRAVLSSRGPRRPLRDTRERILRLAEAVESGDYATLAAAAKRVRRILSAEARAAAAAAVDPALLAEPAERALGESLAAVEGEIAAAFDGARYLEAFLALARLSPPVDRFFDEVLVMAEEAPVRANRLALLVRLDALFAEVGDLGEIESDSGS